jgi:hypothetical protein
VEGVDILAVILPFYVEALGEDRGVERARNGAAALAGWLPEDGPVSECLFVGLRDNFQLRGKDPKALWSLAETATRALYQAGFRG